MKKDSMMDKKQEEPTPDSQRVTWGNRVATVLMIGVVWGVAFLSSSVFGHTWSFEKFQFVLLGFGVYGFTLCALIAVFSTKKSSYRNLMSIAWFFIPVWLTLALFVAAFYESVYGELSGGNLFMSSLAAGQLCLLYFLYWRSRRNQKG